VHRNIRGLQPEALNKQDTAREAKLSAARAEGYLDLSGFEKQDIMSRGEQLECPTS